MVLVNELEQEDTGEIVADENVRDDTETNDVAETVRYRITSYGADFDVEGLVRRLDDGRIFVPQFQRNFVWTLRRASQFIESLLLGLPVPGIFLTLEAETEKLMVIDGQQRLKTLQFFHSGRFGEGGHRKSGHHPFALKGVDTKAFENKRYTDLSEPDRNRLNNALLHATVVKQDFPDDGLSSIFHIYHRLNSTGQPLTPQEIRQAVYRGPFLTHIKNLNDDPDWREVFGSVSPRQKDQELILRFWAMFSSGDTYEAPMLGFLNTFAEANRNPDEMFLQHGATLFTKTIRAFRVALGGEAFRTPGGRQLNAAVFDSMTVGMAHRLQRTDSPVEPDAVRHAHRCLLEDLEYLDSVSSGTARKGAVQTRLHKARHVFGSL